MFLQGTSWQERYGANEIYTLRCSMDDESGMLGKITTIIGEGNGQIGGIELIEVSQQKQIRDIMVFCVSIEQITAISASVNAIDGVEVIEVRDDVLETHRRGTIDIVSKSPISSLTDLRMVYTPGVASVCELIEEKPKTAWDYTGICDRVAIVTNGTAVLGLGDIGTLASLPVMEGKAAIFAEFVGISAVPVLIDSKDSDEIVDIVCKTAGSYGAIQLEDIAAPECFEIEDKLRAKLDIPVLHDDQHGTATVTLAALISALEIVGKKPENCSVIMLGAGAAGIAISKILIHYGIKDILVYDSAGPVYKGRKDKMNPYKDQLAEITNLAGLTCDLSEGFKGRDIFIGVARPNMVSKEMIASMADNPITFPLSNPVGEISKEEAREAGAKVVADGRDCNNALVYPGLFRGALDANANRIDLDMQIAAAMKVAELAPDGELLPDMIDRDVHRQVAAAVSAAYKS